MSMPRQTQTPSRGVARTGAGETRQDLAAWRICARTVASSAVADFPHPKSRAISPDSPAFKSGSD
jgi:hypothetical protein